MKIGVFGDSYADRTPYNPESPIKEDESWVKCLEDAGHKVVSYGKTGSSTYYSFEQFQAHHSQFDHIIFCYSSLHRIHHLPEGLEHLSFLQTPDELYETRQYKNLTRQQELEMVRILTGYIPNVSTPFDQFVKQKIFNDINQMCRNSKIKLINLLTFEDRKDKYLNTYLGDAAGDCLYNLYAVSKKELPTMRDVDNRWCHLSKENNQVLANVLLESFKGTGNNINDLAKHDKFVYSEEITNRYIIE
jgi:hypothetical protein